MQSPSPMVIVHVLHSTLRLSVWSALFPVSSETIAITVEYQRNVMKGVLVFNYIAQRPFIEWRET
jgi:hypothetical protein